MLTACGVLEPSRATWDPEAERFRNERQQEEPMEAKNQEELVS